MAMGSGGVACSQRDNDLRRIAQVFVEGGRTIVAIVVRSEKCPD